MKKIVYIQYDDGKLIGVNNKVAGQCEEFAKKYETILVYTQKNDIVIRNYNNNKYKYIHDKLNVRKYDTSLFQKISNKIRIIKFNSAVKQIIANIAPQIIYVRKYEILNGINILKKYKKNNKVNIIYEIPTYPYSGEFQGFIKKIMYCFHKLIDKRMEKISDAIPIFLGQDIKFKSAKYIPMLNGISLDNISIAKHERESEKVINLLGIANLSFWNGYDRVIEGLKKYYQSNQQTKIIFNIVGNGDEFSKLKKLTDTYNLNEYVIFYRAKTGKELDYIVNKCDIAIGSLGMHRLGLTCASTLKAREYCARGIPFILGYKDTAFVDFECVYNISSDDSAVNLEEVLEFYDKIKQKDYTLEMRKYAEENLTWTIVMKPVLDLMDSFFC